MKTVYRSTLCLLLVSLSVLLVQCKKPADTPVTPDVSADSSSISSLIVSCKSSDASTTGFVVIDVQQFFLTKKLVSSTVKGKIFSIKTVDEPAFKTVVDKFVLDLQVPESYFKNYDSFISIVEEQFKTKTGFQRSYDINQLQIDQLFNKQGVLLAFQESGFKKAFLGSVFFVSAGLGTLKFSPLSETFTLNNFQGLVTVGSKITGTISNNLTVKNFFATGASRSTSLTKDDQVVFRSFINGVSSGYSYYYPLPPSPSPVFDAPAWYWNNIKLPPAVNPFFTSPSPTGYDPGTWTSSEANSRLFIIISKKLGLNYNDYNKIPNQRDGGTVQAIGFGIDKFISSQDVKFLENASYYHHIRTLDNGNRFESYVSQLQFDAPDSAVAYSIFKSAVDGTPYVRKGLLLKKDKQGSFGPKGSYYSNWNNGVWDSTFTSYKIFSDKFFLPK